jgi:hypothetical protein
MTNWEPLRRAFYAESRDAGIEFAHTYYAPDEAAARLIARQQGWNFRGECYDESMSEEAIREYIEMLVHPPMVH